MRSLLCLGLHRLIARCCGTHPTELRHPPHTAMAVAPGKAVCERPGTRLPGGSWLQCWPDTHWDSYHAVSVLSQPLQRQQRVVRLDYNIAHLILVWENRVGLHQLLGIPGEKARPPQGLTPPSQHSLLPQAAFAVSRAQDSSESPGLVPESAPREGENLSQQCLP